MLILFFIIIPITYLVIKLILYQITKRYGKFSYDGLSIAGFAYNSEKDIFLSTKNAWQKNFGYTHTYDVWAPIFRMIVDTEPIRFNYNNKNWLITFWKGQYGIVTGAEIGVYCTNEQKITKRTLYMPVSNNDMLDMSIILYKDKKIISQVHAKHWWLAIFKLGMFSRPKDLSMDINITFKDYQMLEAFLKSFQKLGYTSKDYIIIDRTFCFKYLKPRTKKVWTRNILFDSIRQFFNRKNTELYNTYLQDFLDDNKIDDTKTTNKVIILRDFIPSIIKDKNEITDDITKNIYTNNIIFNTKSSVIKDD